MVCRKNFLNLEPEEKERFIDAVRRLKSSGTESNEYDRYVDIHRDHFFGGMAHGGLGFLPWHREYLNRFENDLQEIDPDVTLPYWDWTEDAARTPDSSLWAEDFMGGTGNPVSTGPFDEWGIERSLGSGTLPTREDVETVLSLTPFSTFTARFEGIHGAPHNWIGGTMARIDSPADPVFWLHHANVDRIWAQWQALHPEQVHPALDEPLHPWATTTREVLDHHRLGYMYDTESAIADPRSSNLVFDGVRVGEAITRPIVFSIRSCVTETVTLEIVDGPTVTSGVPDSRFDTPQGTAVSVTTTGADETEVRLPISYTGTTPGEQTTGTVTVRRRETGEEWIITLSAAVAQIISTPTTEVTRAEERNQRLCDLLVFWYERGVFDEFIEERGIDRTTFEEGLDRFCRR